LENQNAIEDVRANGQYEDIVLLPDEDDDNVLKVLDGRHRQQWCIAADVTPRYRIFGSRDSDGKSPVDFAYSVNTARRHLPDTNVRSAIAAGLQKFWRSEGEGMGKTEAIEKAAAAMDVSPSSVRKAVDVLEHGEDGEFEKLQEGSVQLDEAAKKVAPKKKAAARKVNAAKVTASNPAADGIRRNVAASARVDCGDELADAIEKGTLETLDDLGAFQEMNETERLAVRPLLLEGINLTFARKLLKKVFDSKDKIGYLLARARAEGKKFVVEIDGMEITVRKAKPPQDLTTHDTGTGPAADTPPAAPPEEKKKRGRKKKETAPAAADVPAEDPPPEIANVGTPAPPDEPEPPTAPSDTEGTPPAE
jgi:hypothetical protein